MDENFVTIAEGSEVDELINGPCPNCGEAMLEEINNLGYECMSTEDNQTQIIFVSGVKCANCNEIFFDHRSAELYINTMMCLDHETPKNSRILLTNSGPEKVSVH